MRYLICLLSTFTFASGLYESMALIEKKELKIGYAKLEKAFEETESKEKRVVAGNVLALAQDKYLVNDSLYYAKYVDKFSKEKSSLTYLKIARKLADGYYKENQLKKAHYYYQTLISNEKTTDQLREYAYFKKGWVFVNENKYQNTFNLWDKYLGEFQEGVLRNQLVQDYGKFWMEALYKGAKSHRPKITDKDQEYFYKGIKNGYLRYAYSKARRPFSKIKVSDEFLGQVMSEVIATGIRFQKNPCGLNTYLSKQDLRFFNGQKIFPEVDKCLKQKNVEALRVAQKLKLNSDTSLYLAGQSLKLGDMQYACKKFIAVANDVEKTKELYEGIARSCLKEKVSYAQLLTTNLPVKKDIQVLLFSQQTTLREYLVDNSLPEELVQNIAASYVDNVEIFNLLTEKNTINPETQVLFALQHKQDVDIQRKDLKTLISNSDEIVVESCLKSSELRLVQLEKILRVEKFDLYAQNLNCFEGLAEGELLASLLQQYLKNEKVLKHSSANGKYMDQVKLAYDHGKGFSFRNAPKAFKKLSISKDLGRLAFSVYMANKFKRRVKLAQLPKDFKNLKDLRWRLTQKKWQSRELLNKAFNIFNESLDLLGQKVTKLNISEDKRELLTNSIGGLKI